MANRIYGPYEAVITKYCNERTFSGGWSRTKTLMGKPWTVNRAFYNDFMDSKFPGERREYAYTEAGYLPVRVTVPSFDRTFRYIYEFEYQRVQEDKQ